MNGTPVDIPQPQPHVAPQAQVYADSNAADVALFIFVLVLYIGVPLVMGYMVVNTVMMIAPLVPQLFFLPFRVVSRELAIRPVWLYFAMGSIMMASMTARNIAHSINPKIPVPYGKIMGSIVLMTWAVLMIITILLHFT